MVVGTADVEGSFDENSGGDVSNGVWIMLSMAWLSSDRRIRAGSMTVSLS